MNILYLIKYAVRGIKSIDQWAELSFYKNSFSREFDIKGYNVKGIYGANGAGKTAIISSVQILKNLIQNASYLSESYVQSELQEMINKTLETLEISVDYLSPINNQMLLYRYQIVLKKNKENKYSIAGESLSCRSALSHGEKMVIVFSVENGSIASLREGEGIRERIVDNTRNLLTYASFCPTYFRTLFLNHPEDDNTKNPQWFLNQLTIDCAILNVFGGALVVSTDLADSHVDHYIYDKLIFQNEESNSDEKLKQMLVYISQIKNNPNYMMSPGNITVLRDRYHEFEEEVRQLLRFIRVFKSDIQDIEIDRREDKETFICRLVMVYEGYRVHAEFESTGIKKLIRLFSSFKNMVNGGIVFIDELDSNLHDVYLCALLEYLMEYGEGQLCFTTHNIGPMDVLKKNKKSIDFLSVDHKIYSWTTSGNYSPSKLYRNGMIEGSPFNVDSIDFIGVFERSEES